MSHNKTIVLEWFEEVWNKGREEAIDRLLAKDSRVHGLVDIEGNELPPGPEGFKPFFHAYRDAFPDVHIDVVDTIEQDDKIAVRCEVRATHSGPTLGSEATGAKVAITGMVFVRIKGEKVVEVWNNFDFGSMYQQIEEARANLRKPHSQTHGATHHSP